MDDAIESLGGKGYQSADDDTFSIGVRGLSIDSEEMLKLLSWIALNPNFSKDDFEKEKKRVLDRWVHIADSASTLAGLTFYRALTSGTSYARGSMTRLEQFKKITRKDMIDFYQKHFTPMNSVLMVVGRFDRSKIKKKKKYIEKIII